jgi:hypothetical protein
MEISAWRTTPSGETMGGRGAARAAPLLKGEDMRRRTLAVPAAIALAGAALLGVTAARGASAPSSKTFNLFPNKTFIKCARKSGAVPISAKATVTRGAQNDTVNLTLSGFKPNLGFDLFTVQNSNQASDGSPAPGFTNFGLAWYQSDISTDSNGNASVTVKTILLDQIFGFDPAVSLAPTNTFHVGFWFDSVAEAQPCSATTLTPTPFNGEHNAGPVAFITRPNATTGLGPLCTQPVDNGGSFACNP